MIVIYLNIKTYLNILFVRSVRTRQVSGGFWGGYVAPVCCPPYGHVPAERQIFGQRSDAGRAGYDANTHAPVRTLREAEPDGRMGRTTGHTGVLG